MGIFNNLQCINEVKLKRKETGLPYDVEFASRTTDHVRIKLKDGKTEIASIGMDNGNVKIFHGNINKLSKKEKQRVNNFVTLVWDIIVDAYYKNLDQEVAKNMVLKRLEEYNNKCLTDGRKDDII